MTKYHYIQILGSFNCELRGKSGVETQFNLKILNGIVTVEIQSSLKKIMKSFLVHMRL